MSDLAAPTHVLVLVSGAADESEQLSLPLKDPGGISGCVGLYELLAEVVIMYGMDG